MIAPKIITKAIRAAAGYTNLVVALAFEPVPMSHANAVATIDQLERQMADMRELVEAIKSHPKPDGE